MFKYILPKGKDEYILFICLVLFYFIFSYPIIFNTSIIDSLKIDADTYFSFDTPTYYHRGKMYLSGHPLIICFTYPFLFIGNLLRDFTGIYKYKTLFLALICNIMISTSCIYIYRYLKQIISLNKKTSILIVLIYSLFSTNLVLSFTFESFTFSAFFLCFAIYYYSLYIKEKRSLPLYACILLPIMIGGITITNFSIAILPIILSYDNNFNKIKKIALPCLIMSIIFIYIQSVDISYYSIEDRIDLFSMSNNFVKDSTNLFWGSPILFPSIKTYINDTFFKGAELITINYYTSFFQYFVIGVITFFILYALIKGIKNRLIIICLLTLMINIFIHVIMRFGLSDPFIYGGHWIYTVPILMAWTIFYVKYKIIKKIVIASYIIIFICLLLNNTIRMIEFTIIAESIFPAY